MSNNTGRTEVAAAQSNKYVTINDSDGRLDAALTAILESDYTSGNETLTDDEFQQAVCFRATNLSTARVLTVPDDIPKLFVVDNSAGSDALTVTKNSATEAVAAGETGIFYTDGTTDDLVLLGSAGSGGGSSIVDWKDSVRVATTAAGTLASGFENGDTVDGVTLATNDRILIKDQASAEENGVYTVNASGAPTRANDFDEAAEVTLGAAVWIEEGSANAAKLGILTAASADPVVIDTSTLTFTVYDLAGSGGSYAGFDVENETATSYTVDLADAFKWKELDNASAITATVDPQSSSAFADDTEIMLQQAGAGAVTVAPGSGVTINTAPGLSLTLSGQYAVAVLKRTASDEWTLAGDLLPDNPIGVKASDVASANSIDASAIDGDYADITGTTTIQGFTNLAEGREITFHLDSTPTWEHSANLILPTGDDIIGEAGDVVTIRGESGSVGRVTSWQRASGAAVSNFERTALRNIITGSPWTSRTSAADNAWRSVAWSPELSLFVAVADSGSGNRVMTSPDGITWTIRTSAADNNWYSVAWSPELSLFAAVAASGTGNRVMTSIA